MKRKTNTVEEFGRRHGNWIERSLDKTFGVKPEPFRYRRVHPGTGRVVMYRRRKK